MKLYALLSILGLLNISHVAYAGNEGAHGGDTYSLEFTTIASSIAAQLTDLEAKDDHLFRRWNFTSEQFRRASLGSSQNAPVRVVSQERVYLADQEVEATNDTAKNLIVVSRSAWRESQLHERVRLVLHEYFGILKVEQDRYDASIDFSEFTAAATQEIAKKSVSGGLMANLYYGYAQSFPALNELKTSCDQTTPRIQSAITSATQQAHAHCEISQNTACSLISTTFKEVVSSEIIGMKYCEVLVLMK